MTNQAEHAGAQYEIGRKQLYILPTKIGWYFGLLLVALFGIAVKFDNQAAFMMLFILVGLGNAVMLATHNNAIRIKVTLGTVSNCFSGQVIAAQVQIHNPTKRARQAIYVACGNQTKAIDLDPHEAQSVTLEIPANERGRVTPDPVILSSQFPTGLFFCWTKRAPYSDSAIVYPERVNQYDKPLSQSQGLEDATQGGSAKAQGDFRGLRHYQDGDRLRDVHWPALAKSNKLITKEYDVPSASEHNFQWDDLPKQMSTEKKLSQLAYWIDEAERSGVRYSLSLPTSSFGLDSGASHKHDCLSALALFPKDAFAPPSEEAKQQGIWSRLIRSFNGTWSKA